MKLQINSFEKVYKNHVVKIDDLVIKSRVTYLIGSNGTGKSTLLKAIAGLVSYHGVITNGDSVCYLAENPSYPGAMTVNNFLNSLIKIDNGNSLDNVGELITMFNLEDKLDKVIASLSKGMLQKLNITQCLMQRKDIYLLDEPFSGLDKESVKKLMSYFEKSSSSFLISTHQLILNNKQGIEVISLD
ncbi:MAG: ATP-binding cassette domain-containing protein [Candidatus Izemoplasma sp.]